MSTDVSTILTGAGAALSDRDEQARQAVKVFRALQPTLTSYAKMLTKRNDVRVEMHSTINGATDGSRIFYRPPLALGDRSPHVRKLCDKRDDALQQRCDACRRREETLVVIYHEIGHLCSDSFAQTSDHDRARLIEEAVKHSAGKYAKYIAARIQAAPSYTKNSYIGMAGLVNEFLPIILNALEDARVNRDLFRARKGTKKMFDALAYKTFTEGVEQKNPAGEVVVIPWNEYPQNMQVIIGLFCAASGYDFDDWFVTPVVEALHDEKLTDLIRRMDTIRSASGVYDLSFPILSRLRDLGFCKLDTDPTDEEEDEQTQDDDTSAGLSESNNETESGESEPEAGKDSEGSESPDAEPDKAGGEDRDDSSTGSSAGVPDSGGEEESGTGADVLDVDEDSDDADSEGSGVGNSDDTTGSDEDRSGGSEVEHDRDEGGADSREVDDEAGPDSGSTEADKTSPASEASEGDDSEDSRGDSVDDSQDDGSPNEEASTDSPAESDDTESSEDSEEADLGNADDSNGQGTGDITGDELDDQSADGQDDLAEPNQSPGQGGDGNSSDRDRSEDPDQDNREGSSRDTGDNPSDVDETTNDEVTDSDNGESEMDSSESSPDTGGVESEESDFSDDVIDTGADDGTGGTKVIEAEEDLPEMGTADEVEKALKQWGHHDEPPKTVQEVRQEKVDEEAIDRAIIQGMYFETPSAEVHGVHEYNFDDPDHGGAWDHSVFTASGYSLKSLGIDGEFDPPESIMGPALLQMRRTFTDNARGKDLRNLRGGRVNPKVLGRRAPFGDDRLFTKRRMPGKKKYFVLIGVDVSGSTVGTNIALEKRAVSAQAELCSRLGIDFAVYAHTGSGFSGDFWLDIYRIKERHEPCDIKTRERLHQIGPDSGNLDGHTLEYYRKRLDESDATDKIIMYYTDGKMPAANYDEELEILQRELQVCRAKKYTVMGVGIRTDSPIRHGLDTVQVDGDEDISRVVKHLEKRLLVP